MTCQGVKRAVGPPVHCEGCSEKNTFVEGSGYIETSPQQAFEDSKATLTEIFQRGPSPEVKKSFGKSSKK